MNNTNRTVCLALVDAFLIFAIIAVLPFAWILRDGLGPGAVASSGWETFTRTFMTFYVGPAILGLTALDLLLRRGAPAADNATQRKALLLPVAVFLALIGLGALAYGLLQG